MNTKQRLPRSTLSTSQRPTASPTIRTRRSRSALFALAALTLGVATLSHKASAETPPAQAQPAQAQPAQAQPAQRPGVWHMPHQTGPATQTPLSPHTPRTAPAPNAHATAAYPGYRATPYPSGHPGANAAGSVRGNPHPYPSPGTYPHGSAYPAGPVAPDVPSEEEPTAPFFDLAVGTYVPLSLGGQATLELPGRVLLQLDVGWMPPAYGSAINGIVQAVGGYDSAIGQIVDGSLEDAVVVRVSGGFRPFASAGFEIFGGYTHVALSGSVSPETVANVVGGSFAAQVAEQLITSDIDVSSRLHNFHVALGWRWVAFDHLVIRTTVGYTQTVGSSSEVESVDSPEVAALASPVVDTEMGKVYADYVKLPVVGLSGGYRF